MDAAIGVLRAQLARFKTKARFHCEATLPMTVPIPVFLQLIAEGPSLDRALLLPLVHNIGPFLAANFQTLTEQDSDVLWLSLTVIGRLLESDVEFFGFTEAVAAAMLYFPGIPPCFINFLVVNPPGNRGLVPHLLVSMVDGLPSNFFSKYSRCLLPLIAEFLTDGDAKHRLSLMRILSLMELRDDIPELKTNLSSAIYSIFRDAPDLSRRALRCIRQLTKRMPSFRDLLKQFHVQKMDSCQTLGEFLPIVRVISSFDPADLWRLFEKIMSPISKSIFESGDIDRSLLQAFDDATWDTFRDKPTDALYSICSKFIPTEFYPGAIFSLSIFLDRFLNMYEENETGIIQVFTDGLDSRYPLKTPLCFGVTRNAALFAKHPEVVQYSLLPSLLRCVVSYTKGQVEWAFRALGRLLSKSSSVFPLIDAILALFKSVTDDAIPSFFRFLTEFKQAVPAASSTICRFVASMMTGGWRPLIRSEALGVAKLFLKRKEFEELAGRRLRVAMALLMGPLEDAYVPALAFIATALKWGEGFGDLKKAAPRILAIATADLPVSPKVRIAFLGQLARIQAIDFPFNAVHCFLGDESNSEFQTAAVIVVQKLLRRFDPDHLVALFGVVLFSMKRSTFLSFVNQAYSLAEDLVNFGVASADVENLVRVTMLGRLSIFNGVPPYLGEGGAVAFCPFLKAYVDKFPQLSGWIVQALVRWIPRLVVPIADVLLVTLRHDLIDPFKAREVLTIMGDEISEEGYKFDEVRPVVNFCLRLRQKFGFELGVLTSCLERLWENHHQKESFVRFLMPLLLEVFTDNTYFRDIHPRVMADIVHILVTQRYTLDIPKMLSYFVQIHDRAVPFPDRDDFVAHVFVTFLIRSQEGLDDLDFDVVTLKDMHRCFKHIAKNNRAALRDVEQGIAGNPALAARYKVLLKAGQRPEF
jgi:hypothetical protein